MKSTTIAPSGRVRPFALLLNFKSDFSSPSSFADASANWNQLEEQLFLRKCIESAKALWFKFMAPNAPFEVNLSADARASVWHLLRPFLQRQMVGGFRGSGIREVAFFPLSLPSACLALAVGCVCLLGKFFLFFLAFPLPLSI